MQLESQSVGGSPATPTLRLPTWEALSTHWIRPSSGRSKQPAAQNLDKAFNFPQIILSGRKHSSDICFHDLLSVHFCVPRKYKLGVIIDLHAAPGSQNGYEHSASRDGSQEWGTTDANIALTVQVIDFLASRSVVYITRPCACYYSLPIRTSVDQIQMALLMIDVCI